MQARGAMEPSLDGKPEPEGGLRRGQYSLRSLFVLTTLVAVVCGLVKWHGSGVLVVIIWNAVAGLIAMAVGRKKRKAAAASLLSLFAGWCVAFVVLAAWRGQDNGFRDFSLWLIGPAVFAFLGWVLFVIPVIGFVRADGLIYRPWFSPIAGTGLALIAYLILVCSLEHDMWQAIWFPAIIGAVAGILFPFLARSSCPAYVLLSSPSILCLTFWCLSWPVLENLAPDFTYRYGSLDVQARSMHRILSSIEIGASATELRRRYPAVFSHPIGATHGSISTERYDYEFEVVVDQENGTVARVSSKLRERQE